MEQAIIYLATGLMIGPGGLGASIDAGMSGSNLVAGCARQTEPAPAPQSRFYSAMGTVDVIPMIALALGLCLVFAAAPGV